MRGLPARDRPGCELPYFVGLFDLLVVLPVWPPVAAGPPVSPTALPVVTPAPAPLAPDAPDEAPLWAEPPEEDFFAAFFLAFFLVVFVPEESLAPLASLADELALLLGAWVFPGDSFCAMAYPDTRNRLAIKAEVAFFILKTFLE
jgi:hypothetical protein